MGVFVARFILQLVLLIIMANTYVVGGLLFWSALFLLVYIFYLTVIEDAGVPLLLALLVIYMYKTGENPLADLFGYFIDTVPSEFNPEP